MDKLSELEREIICIRKRVTDDLTLKQLHILLVVVKEPGMSQVDILKRVNVTGKMNEANVKVNLSKLAVCDCVSIRDSAYSGNRKAVYPTDLLLNVLREMAGIPV